MKLKEYNFIKERRESLGITQRELAKEIGMAQSTYSKFENTDFKEIRVCDLEKIIKVLFDEDFDILQEIAVLFHTPQYDNEIIKINLPLPENEELHKPENDFKFLEDSIEKANKELDNQKNINTDLRIENDCLYRTIKTLEDKNEHLVKVIKNMACVIN